MTSETITHSPEETIVFGRSLAAELSPPLIVLLRGDLGAGKTTLVKGIAEAHGGKVILESMKDKGTTFTLELPIQER